MAFDELEGATDEELLASLALKDVSDEEIINSLSQEVDAPVYGPWMNQDMATWEPEKQAAYQGLTDKIKKIDDELSKSKQYTTGWRPIVASLLEDIGGLVGGVIGGGVGATVGGGVGAFGGPVAPVTIPLATVAGAGEGATQGGVLGRAAGQELGEALGTRPNMSLDDQSTYSSQAENIDDERLLNYGLFGAGKLLGGAQYLYKLLFPSKKLIAFEEAQLAGSIPSRLGAPKSSGAGELARTKKLIKAEDEFVKANPMEGVNPEAPGAWESFRENLKSIKQNAMDIKNGFISKFDNILASKKAYLLPSKSAVDDVLKDSPYPITEEGVLKAEGILDDLFYKTRKVSPEDYAKGEPETFLKDGELWVKEQKPFSLKEAEVTFKKLGKELEALGSFDDLKLGKKITDPSFWEKTRAQREGLEVARSVLLNTMDDALANTVGVNNPIVKANKTIHAMILYDQLADRYAAQVLQEIGPQGTSSGNIRSIKDLITNGWFQDLAERQARAAASGLTGKGPFKETLAGIKNDIAVKSGRIKREDLTSIPFDFLSKGTSQIKPSGTTGLVAEQMAAFSPEAYGVAIPETEAAEIPKGAFPRPNKDDFKPLFEAPLEIPSMKEDGSISDEADKKIAEQALRTLYEGDTIKRAKEIKNLRQGVPISPESMKALGATLPNADKNLADSFLEQVEGGFRYKPYNDSNKGIAIGTGTNLGQQSIDGLRNLGVPESTIQKISHLVGVKGQTAVNKLNRNPLTLSKEETEALDDLVKNNLRKTVQLKYEEASGGSKIEDLPEEVQAVVYSLSHNLGGKLYSREAYSKVWDSIVKNDWSALSKSLSRLKDLPSRRKQEAALLTPLTEDIQEQEGINNQGEIIPPGAKMVKFKDGTKRIDWDT